MRIRKATPADIAQIAAAERDIFPAEAWSEEVIRLSMAHEQTVFYVAEDADVPDTVTQDTGQQAADSAPRIAGYVVLTTVAGEGNIDNVCVLPPYRGQGLAARLLRETIAAARIRHGAQAFTLEVRVSNTAARALYESLGFLCEGIRPGYYEAPREDAYIYWKRNI